VAAALLLNAGIEVAFTYREHQAMLERLQGEKADAAAQRIAQFVSVSVRGLCESFESVTGAGLIRLDRV